MTNDKATALREAARDGAWAERRRVARGHATLSEIAKINRFRALADPPTILDLLAERERLRGALEQVRRMANQFEVYHPKLGGASHCFGQISDAARQALEATDDQ